MMRVTIAVPEKHLADANQLARCIGLGPDDDKSFTLPNFQDALGNLYCVASGIVSPAFIGTATSKLAAPEWGCDLDAAIRAQALVALGSKADPSRIAAMVGEDAHGTIKAMGLQSIPPAGDEK